MASVWAVVGAIFPLNSLGHYFTWHWINIGVANLIVIGLMIVAFVAALFFPFPGRAGRQQSPTSPERDQ